MKSDDKRGQFYLVASAIIVVLIVSFFSITNPATKKNPPRIEDYGKELKIESGKVLDYDYINNENKIENFTKEYSDFLGSEVNSYFILVNGAEQEAYYYLEDVKIDASANLTVDTEKIIFTTGDSDYQFNLNKGQNFYFILSQDIEGEKYVYTN